jgi:sialidase-1
MFWLCATDATRAQVIVDIASHFEVRLQNGLLMAEVAGATVSTACPSLNAWHHVAVSASEQLSLFVDGQAVASTPLSQNPGWFRESILRIGGYTDPAGGHFDHTFGREGTGWVDEVRFFPTALDATEVAKLIPPAMTPPDVDIIVGDGQGFSVATDDLSVFRFLLWDFGDGNTAIGETVAHEHPYAGTYTVQLTAVTTDYQQVFAEQSITIENGQQPLQPTSVFINGIEGHACYRIPSIVRAANGDLVAFAEARLESCSDSTDTVRVVCKRSTDNGQTWLPLQIIGRNIVDGREYAVQNPSPVPDAHTGRLLLLYNKLENSEWELAEGIGRSRIFRIISDDNGVTWHSERDITVSVQQLNWQMQRPTLGHAVQLASGRLFFAGVFTEANNSVFDSQNYAFWSDDGGQTWVIGGVIPQVGLNEAIAVELENGDVMVNSRAYRNQVSVGRRAVTIGRFTDDYSITFDPTRYDDALIDPAVQASIIRFTSSDQSQYGSKSRILFSNPNHPKARYNLTVRLSYDEGQTWPVHKVVDSGPSAYSDLVIQSDMRLGVLYERGNQGGIAYASFSLDWLTDGNDTLEVTS